jgi:hypothetical protein
VRLVLLLSAILFIGATDSSIVTRQVDRLDKRIKTTYSILGRVVNQAQNAKGLHRVSGNTKLVAGVDTITLNVSTALGRQDVSYLSSSSYRGWAWSLDPANDSTYKVVPLSGTQFLIKSSGGTDTATVQFVVEGE